MNLGLLLGIDPATGRGSKLRLPGKPKPAGHGGAARRLKRDTLRGRVTPGPPYQPKPPKMRRAQAIRALFAHAFGLRKATR